LQKQTKYLDGLTDVKDPENHFKFLRHVENDVAISASSHRFQVNELEILFPCKPYQVQIDYMSKVIEACSDAKNALLESPTGTGKTFCLLVASLAWLQHRRAT
jgi:regulator of telomere elongation helicase 1